MEQEAYMDSPEKKGPILNPETPGLEKINFDAFWNYVHAFGRACDFIGKNFGDQALRQFFFSRGRETKLPRLIEAQKVDGLLFMKAFCQGLNNIGSDFSLVENEQEIVVRGTCNTGGRYVRDEQGASNENGIPYYCMHCSIWWEELPKEIGFPLTFQRAEKGIGCAWHLKK
jgi:hypothetical protein